MGKEGVLIAGIAGASLGTEIAKCLRDSAKYRIYGCDISGLAFGHYSTEFKKTYVIDQKKYLLDIISICLENDIRYIIPGGEAPLNLLVEGELTLMRNNLKLVSNSSNVVEVCSDKAKTFSHLRKLGFSIPFTKEVSIEDDFEDVIYPCIVKPSTGTGGSDSVFLALNKDEALQYFQIFQKNSRKCILQEYISEENGEYTIGVLSLPDSSVVGAIVMRRIFNSKLSIAHKSNRGLISTGYSQGLIERNSSLENEAIRIAKALESTGPLNIQGRIKNGILLPFEINPRFSASTYLRAKAGFNEIDMYLQNLIDGNSTFNYIVKEGYYLRSFEERFVSKEATL